MGDSTACNSNSSSSNDNNNSNAIIYLLMLILAATFVFVSMKVCRRQIASFVKTFIESKSHPSTYR